MSVATLHAEFEAAKADARELLSGVGDPAFHWRRAPGTWSMAECLDHLNVVGRKYLRAIDRAIEQGRNKGLLGAGPFRYGLLEGWAVRAMDAPPMFRVKAPRAFAPAAERRLDNALAAFLGPAGRVPEEPRPRRRPRPREGQGPIAGDAPSEVQPRQGVRGHGRAPFVWRSGKRGCSGRGRIESTIQR